ncbi:MAG: iron-only hydrogenase system regulator [Firmicutes bacterium]|nr:iron-only hydrogenase system regulator [Bacillota bacterium]
MDTRVALLSIIVNDQGQTEELNRLLHEYRNYVIGRMGIPHPVKDICIISVALDAPQDAISALSGKIGRLRGVSSKTTFSQF